MAFTTDQQTLDDLRIFGRSGNDATIFGLFQRTATRGGAQRMEELFRYPLSTPEAINDRCAILSFFSGRREPFPCSTEAIDAVQLYIEMIDERTRLAATRESLQNRLTSLMGTDTEFQVIRKGVTMLIDLLRSLRAFLKGLDPRPNDHPYQAHAKKITGLLDEPALLPLQQVSTGTKLSYEQIAEWDAPLRFRHRSVIHKLLQLVYELDVYLTVANLAREKSYTFPVALPGERHLLNLQGCYHPLLSNPVPNDLNAGRNSNVIFLTGANMAGKSTLMKSLGIAVYLAHMGFPVPAARMEFSVLDGLYTTINLPDDLGMGASHFYAEVLRVKKMALELSRGKDLLIIFDELFRGTNVKDAYEATVAVATAFARKRHSLFVISTHIIEAGEELRQLQNIQFVYLPTRMEGHRPVYTYTLEQGITADRHGMIIIQNEGILDILQKHKDPQHALHHR